MTGPAPLRVFLLDDHEVVRTGLRGLLEDEPDLEVVGEGGTAAEALDRVPKLRPDVAVLDVRLPDGDGVSVCRELRAGMPGLHCLMLTSYDDEEARFGALEAGAAGYLLKHVRVHELVGAIRTVGRGGLLHDPGEVARPAGSPLDPLTAQERRILDLVGEGLTNRQIGERLSLAEKTVKNNVSSILGKLGLARRTQAAVLVTNLRTRPPDQM